MSWNTRLLCLAVAVALTFPPWGSATPSSPGEQHLPDLRTMEPKDFRLDREGGTTLLRFWNAIWNAGHGPLEAHPRHDRQDGTTTAIQRIFTHDGAGEWTVVQEREAGSFEFHESHDHWHFANLADYSLFRMVDGRPTSEVVASSDKIGFCMFDEFKGGASSEHVADEAQYHGARCDQNFTQGYSVGWGDAYRPDFPGQFIDISGIEPGDYFLHSEADPSDLLVESDEENNGAGLGLRLGDDRVRIITRTRAKICRPCGRTRLRAGRTFRFTGTTLPAEDGQPIRFEFRMPFGRWRPFGHGSRKPFMLLAQPENVTVDEDGRWSARFRATRAGTRQIRAKAKRTGRSTRSSVRLEVRVTR